MTNLSKYLLGGVAAVVACFLLWYFSDIVIYILIAAILAILGRPIVVGLGRVTILGRRIPQWLSAGVALISIWAVMLLFFFLFIPLVSAKVSEFASLDLQHFVDSFREPLAMFQNFLYNTFAIQESDFSIADTLTKQISAVLDINALNTFFTSAVATVGHVVVALFSVTFITFFFLKDDQLFVNMVVAVFPEKYENNIKHALGSVTNLLIRYFTGLLFESTVMMLLISSALMLWGMPASDAFFIGLLMGVLNVIPYIGPLIGASLGVVIGVLNPIVGVTVGGTVIIIACTIAVCKGLDDFVLQPLLYSKRVKAHPLEIFLVILIAGSVAGVLGMLLAIPAYNVIRVFAKEFFNNFKLVQKLTEKI